MVKVSNVICPKCRGPATQISSEEMDSGCMTGTFAETWQCLRCGQSFGLECERVMSYYFYTDEQYVDYEDYEIDWRY